MDLQMSRRTLLRTGAAGAALALITPAGMARPAPSRARRRGLRVAHLTDLHIQPELRADEGVTACLRHLRSLPEPPDLVLLGGDLIMDGFAEDEGRTRLQWDLYTKVLRDECPFPVEPCLGNHDIWGWNKSRSRTTGDEPGWGKKWAMDVLGLDRTYRSFDRGGWHFVVLDSVQPEGNGYTGRIDNEQFEWLHADLAAVPAGRPTLVLTHIPILTATVVLGDPKRETRVREVPSALLMEDSRSLRDLFARHPTVRLALSGHMHRIDRVDFRGVTYLCNGAVSGNWWKGPYHECNEGYAVLDLYDDGTFDHRYERYGWTV